MTTARLLTVCQYDQCDGAYRIAYLDEGTFAIAAGYYGAYLVTDYGKTITKMDSVSYCKTMGYGAAAKDGDPYTLYMYGKPADSDPEGIYRSTDCGKSWVLINQNHLYGGTGNGNYLVGDMNTFGTVYMSTVGCGIVVGKVNGSEDPKPVTTDTTQTTKATTTTTSTTTVSTAASTKDSAASTTIATTIVTTLPQTTDSTGVSTTASGKNTATVPAGATLYGDTTTTASGQPTPSGAVLYGDTNLDGRVDITDAVLLNKAAAGAVSLAAQAAKNADCNANGEVGSDDAVSLLKFLVQIIKNLPEVAE